MSVVENPQKYVHLIPDTEEVLNRHVDRLKWCVIKFFCPEDVIQKRNIFELNRFLYHDVNKQLIDMATNVVMNINNSFSNSLNKVIDRLEASKKKEEQLAAGILSEIRGELKLDEEYHSTNVLRQYRLDGQELTDRFETYKLENKVTLEKDFGLEVTTRTSIRAFKVSGAHETLAESRSRAEYVNKNIEPHINSYVAPMNVWVPLDPNPDAVQDQEYMLDELNDLMGKYKENVEKKNEFFEKRKNEMINKARENNNAVLKEQLKLRLEEPKSSITEQRTAPAPTSAPAPAPAPALAPTPAQTARDNKRRNRRRRRRQREDTKNPES